MTDLYHGDTYAIRYMLMSRVVIQDTLCSGARQSAWECDVTSNAMQALLRGDFGEDDTIVVSAPGGETAEGLRLSHGNSRNGARSRAEAQGLTDAVLLGSAGASADDA